MRVRVLLFGILKDKLGEGEHTLELPAEATVEHVLSWAALALGNSDLTRSLAVAVNREYASARSELREGDEVALLPPVSGGRR